MKDTVENNGNEEEKEQSTLAQVEAANGQSDNGSSVETATSALVVAPVEASSQQDGDNNDDGERRLTIIEHLDELRQRIIVSLIAVAITTALSFIFAKQLFAILKVPAGDTLFQAIEVTELITTYFKVSLFAGFILAIPVLIYEVVMFVAPALTPKEKKYFFLLLPGALISFVVGVVFGYYLILPPAITFLLTFGADIATPVLRIGNYVSTVTRLLFYIGVIFETPLIIYFLCKMRIVTPKKLSGFRKYAVVLAFVASAVITPTPDPVNQTLVAIPLILLYEIGILLARIL